MNTNFLNPFIVVISGIGCIMGLIWLFFEVSEAFKDVTRGLAVITFTFVSATHVQKDMFVSSIFFGLLALFFLLRVLKVIK